MPRRPEPGELIGCLVLQATTGQGTNGRTFRIHTRYQEAETEFAKAVEYRDHIGGTYQIVIAELRIRRTEDTT